MKPVFFLKNGAPYGYGYSAGESGTVRVEDLAALLAAGVVREAEPPAETREKAVPKAAKETR